ncbi:DUF2971 domain-containing protein [Pseudomonas sp. RIT357]|uniref:DUF2971 domain-containing protein n=1 Tax=Pseudomonas sp. RIT357 TaxID=1470593 RepID=UPI000449B923|nr:DUF2971 domain-containing protein [Pseudomonas sp. RIT357]EZP64206.1 hypothetical protein BW43_04146 [Pseudomonas sp. RIT357]
MDIHHYTRASTLPLILQSGKIRFTRADQLDDGSEMPFKTAHVDAQNFFVSSWTSSVSEHSGQWFRYGDQHRGIRITLPHEPFEYHRVSWKLSRGKVGIELIDITIPFTITEMLGNGYVLNPSSHDMSKDFGGAVEYVENPQKRVQELISHTECETTIHNTSKLGRIKSDAWADQFEYRFVLMAYQGADLDQSVCRDSYETALLDLFEGYHSQSIAPPKIKYIDLPLAKVALDKMVVTLGSNISNDDRAAINQAINLHSPQVRIEESGMNVRTAL